MAYFIGFNFFMRLRKGLFYFFIKILLINVLQTVYYDCIYESMGKKKFDKKGRENCMNKV